MNNKTKQFFYLLFVNQPKIQTASKFERRADNKTYEDKQRLFDGVSFQFMPFSVVIFCNCLSPFTLPFHSFLWPFSLQFLSFSMPLIALLPIKCYNLNVA